MPSPNIPQSTIDKITEQIMAKVRPALDDAISRTAVALAAESMSGPKILEVESIPPPDFGAANYIWTHETPYKSPPFGPRAFRKLIIIPSGESVDSMILDVNCHYTGCLYVNGKMVGHIHSTPMRFSIKFPSTDRVVVAASATQEHGISTKKPAGIIISAVTWNSTRYKGRTFAINTDASWEASITAVSAASGFVNVDYTPDDSWDHARVEGPFGMAPWEQTRKPTTTTSVNDVNFSPAYTVLKPFNAPLAASGPPAEYIL